VSVGGVGWLLDGWIDIFSLAQRPAPIVNQKWKTG
jgi:hypothetical protein